MLGSIAPFFVVGDIDASIRHYERLGFGILYRAPDAPWFAIVARDAVHIHLKHIAADVAPRPNHTLHEWAPWDAFVYTPDPDALAAEFGEACADRDDGLRGFEVRDPDGYALFFGRPA